MDRDAIEPALHSVCRLEVSSPKRWKWLVDGHPVRLKRRKDGLEERRAAGLAVAASARRQAERNRAVVQRPAAVARLGADRRLDEPADGTGTLVADRHIERLNDTRVRARR